MPDEFHPWERPEDEFDRQVAEELDRDDYDHDDDIVGSCDDCGGNMYRFEDDGSGLCDQCQWRAAGGPTT